MVTCLTWYVTIFYCEFACNPWRFIPIRCISTKYRHIFVFFNIGNWSIEGKNALLETIIGRCNIWKDLQEQTISCSLALLQRSLIDGLNPFLPQHEAKSNILCVWERCTRLQEESSMTKNEEYLNWKILGVMSQSQEVMCQRSVPSRQASCAHSSMLFLIEVGSLTHWWKLDRMWHWFHSVCVA